MSDNLSRLNSPNLTGFTTRLLHRQLALCCYPRRDAVLPESKQTTGAPCISEACIARTGILSAFSSETTQVQSTALPGCENCNGLEEGANAQQSEAVRLVDSGRHRGLFLRNSNMPHGSR